MNKEEEKSKITNILDALVKEAPLCSCKDSEHRVSYICQDDSCPDKHQQLYCFDCRDEGRHKHDVKRLKVFVSDIITSWHKIISDVTELTAKAEERYKQYKNVIDYFNSKV